MIIPYSQIAINGRVLDNTRMSCITSIEFRRVSDGSDSVVITLEDPSHIFIEDDIFVEDVPIHAVNGLKKGIARDKFDGYISVIDIDFPEDGVPVLTVVCMDEGHLMNKKKKSRTWDNCTRPDVIQKVVAEYGFSFYKDPNYQFETLEVITQSDQTDLDFVESLAQEEKDPFMAKLMDKTFYYVRRGFLGIPVMSLDYRNGDFNLLRYKPRITKETRKEEVVKQDVDTKTKKKLKAVANKETVPASQINAERGGGWKTYRQLK
jgi:hypothetical protein